MPFEVPIKGLTAALTPPLPNEKRKTLTPSPAGAAPSFISTAGIDVIKRIKAPRKTILEQGQSSIYGSPASPKDLHGRNKDGSEATKPRVCHDRSQYRSKVGKGAEARHD